MTCSHSTRSGPTARRSWPKPAVEVAPGFGGLQGQDGCNSFNHVIFIEPVDPEAHTAGLMPRNRPPRPGTTYPASISQPSTNWPSRVQLQRPTRCHHRASTSTRFKDRPTEPTSAHHQTLTLDQRGTATTTSIRRASTQRALWTRESQPTSHAAYRPAPAQPTRRAHLRSRA
jgi:hypothetical protein